MAGEIDKKTTGSWLVHHTNKLQQVSGARGFNRIVHAGKAATLLSALSATEQNVVDTPRVEVLAAAANINDLELDTLLAKLEERQLLQRSSNGVEVYGVTNATVLQRGAEVFESLNPSPQERASIGLAEIASIQPVEKGIVSEELSDTYKMTKAVTEELLAQAEQIGLVDNERHQAGAVVYFNGNLFRHGETEKVSLVLQSLSSADQQRVQEVDQMLRRQGCVALENVEASLGKALFDKLSSIGMYDVNVVSNPRENIGFATRPAAFSKYGTGLIDDSLDLAKAFVSSLTYGITRSTPGRGRIDNVDLLLNKLIRGEWTGAATAIEQDYVALELRGVVELRRGARWGHQMRLRKKDVGQMALQVLRSGDTSDVPLRQMPVADVTAYIGPEANRAIRRKDQVPESKRAVRDMVEVLRTGRGR